MSETIKQSTESLWSRVEVAEDSRSITFHAKPTSSWEQMKAWLEEQYPDAHWTYRGFGKVGEDFQVVLIKRYCEKYNDGCSECGSEDSDDDDDSSTSSEDTEDSDVPCFTTAFPFADADVPHGFVAMDMDEKLWKYDKPSDMWEHFHEQVWYEECCECGKWLGNKIFTDENEFDEHPDRDPGYDLDGNWWCGKCRDSDLAKEIGLEQRRKLIASRSRLGECSSAETEWLFHDYRDLVKEFFLMKCRMEMMEKKLKETPKKTKEERMAELEANLRVAFGETDKSAFP